MDYLIWHDTKETGHLQSSHKKSAREDTGARRKCILKFYEPSTMIHELKY